MTSEGIGEIFKGDFADIGADISANVNEGTGYQVNTHVDMGKEHPHQLDLLGIWVDEPFAYVFFCIP